MVRDIINKQGQPLLIYDTEIVENSNKQINNDRFYRKERCNKSTLINDTVGLKIPNHVDALEVLESHDRAEAEIAACEGWTPVVWLAFQDAADAAPPEATHREIGGDTLKRARQCGCPLRQYYKAKKQISTILAKWGLI